MARMLLRLKADCNRSMRDIQEERGPVILRAGTYTACVPWSLHEDVAMPELYDQVQEARAFIQSRWSTKPRTGIILGTGLGGLVEDIQADVKLSYSDVPHFPR